MAVWVYCVMRFNTQPPEGGWGRQTQTNTQPAGFNTQPPEGGWLSIFTDTFISR